MFWMLYSSFGWYHRIWIIQRSGNHPKERIQHVFHQQNIFHRSTVLINSYDSCS
jgi:hypothetical protein